MCRRVTHPYGYILAKKVSNMVQIISRIPQVALGEDDVRKLTMLRFGIDPAEYGYDTESREPPIAVAERDTW